MDFGLASERSRTARIDTADEPGSVARWIQLGTLFGVGLHGVNEDHPEDTQLGLPAWIGIGNLAVLAVDGVSAAVIVGARQ